MSGHSKWSTIKHKKGLKDAKRGALFTKLARDITMAASEGGGDINMNFSLRLVVDKAKEANMPKDNIERSIKKGTGEIEGGRLTRISYEAYGPQGVAILIDTTTDNTNRTVSEVKRILDSKSAKMAKPGSVSWQFDQKGLIVVAAKRLKENEKFGKVGEYTDVDTELLILELMEVIGVEDIQKQDGLIEIITSKDDFKRVYDAIVALKVKIASSEIISMANEPIDLNDEALTSLYNIVESLEEHDDVDAVWTNVKNLY